MTPETPDPQTPQADPWANLAEWTVQILDELRSPRDCRTYRADEVDAARATVERRHAEEVRGLRAAIRYLEDTSTANSALADERRQHAEMVQMAETATALERQSTVRLRAAHAAQIAERDAEIARLSALAEGACADAFTHCACGCPISDHESYDEDGEQCEHEGHECFRVSASAAATITHLRALVTQREQERDAKEAMLRGLPPTFAQGLITATRVRAEEAEARAERAEAALTAMCDAAEMLCVVLANVSGGDWTQQTPDWQEAAARWRDAYFAAFTAIHPVPAPPTGEPTA